jgi:hypothetical protein
MRVPTTLGALAALTAAASAKTSSRKFDYVIEQLWREYKNDEPAAQRQYPPAKASVQVDEWYDDEEDVQSSVDQLAQYYAKPPHDR